MNLKGIVKIIYIKKNYGNIGSKSVFVLNKKYIKIQLFKKISSFEVGRFLSISCVMMMFLDDY